MTDPLKPYEISYDTPDPDTYRMLREQTGLSPKSAEAAEAGLKGTLFSVQVIHQGSTVGMGRLIGDGGCHFQVVDIAVLPDHQGKGLGKVIMKEIAGYIQRELPDTAYISLIADGPAKHLYEKFGFKETAPVSVGMAMKVKREK
jgi:ribosomal protein S18 acetylase RimI-like enzyme